MYDLLQFNVFHEAPNITSIDILDITLRIVNLMLTPLYIRNPNQILQILTGPLIHIHHVEGVDSSHLPLSKCL